MSALEDANRLYEYESMRAATEMPPIRIEPTYREPLPDPMEEYQRSVNARNLQRIANELEEANFQRRMRSYR